MSQRSKHLSRKNDVLTQYGNSKAAADYARSNEGSGPEARFYKSRIQLIHDILSSCPGGDLLDAGCGPGVMVLTLLRSRPDDFSITAMDQSPAMIQHFAAKVRNAGKVRLIVGELEAMPFDDATFDVVLVMGSLEYTDMRRAIPELSRITRQDGVVIVTMLNPLSLYRLTEWFLLWPAGRAARSDQEIVRPPLRATARGTSQWYPRTPGIHPPTPPEPR